MKKSRRELNRYELGKFDLERIKGLLKEKPRSSKELMEELGTSSSVIKRRLDVLMRRGEIMSYEEPSDRRRRLYRIADEEKVKVSSAVYLAGQFLESLKNPYFKEAIQEVGNYAVTVGCFIEGQPEQKLDNAVENIDLNVSQIAQYLTGFLEIAKQAGARITKIALIVTAEEKQ